MKYKLLQNTMLINDYEQITNDVMAITLWFAVLYLVCTMLPMLGYTPVPVLW